MKQWSLLQRHNKPHHNLITTLTATTTTTTRHLHHTCACGGTVTSNLFWARNYHHHHHQQHTSPITTTAAATTKVFKRNLTCFSTASRTTTTTPTISIRQFCSSASKIVTNADGTAEYLYVAPLKLQVRFSLLGTTVTLLVPPTHTVKDVLVDTAAHFNMNPLHFYVAIEDSTTTTSTNTEADSNHVEEMNSKEHSMTVLPLTLLASSPHIREMAGKSNQILRFHVLPKEGSAMATNTAASHPIVRNSARQILIAAMLRASKAPEILQDVSLKIPVSLFREECVNRRTAAHSDDLEFSRTLDTLLGIDPTTLLPYKNDCSVSKHAGILETLRSYITPQRVADSLVKALETHEEHVATIRQYRKLLQLTDMREPHTWFPDARAMKRNVILHVGPTNSGKTHAAIEALRHAKSGIYCGPLRLLAWEIFERLNTHNVPCDLVTGVEVVRIGSENLEPITPLKFPKPSAIDIFQNDPNRADDQEDSKDILPHSNKLPQKKVSNFRNQKTIDDDDDIDMLDDLDDTEILELTSDDNIDPKEVSSSSKDNTESRIQSSIRSQLGSLSEHLNVLESSPDDDETDTNVDMIDSNNTTNKTMLEQQQQQQSNDGRFSRHVSCTVEMANITDRVQVGVIDEIQLMGNPQRGQAFTRALLGLPVCELHLCGAPSAVPLIQKLLEQTGDNLEIREYSRLAPLNVVHSLGENWEKIRPGDCLIEFSRRGVYLVKRAVEKAWGGKMKCAVVYGSLPPELRRKQALSFNNGECHVLVATDAVGMGLNLQIKRVVFMTLTKFDGETNRDLEPSEIQQIAGRAGRFGSRHARGEVTTWNASDLPKLQHALASPLGGQPITQAGVFPSPSQILTFSRAHPGLPLHEVLLQVCDLAQVSDSYFVADVSDMVNVAQLVEDSGAAVSMIEAIVFALSPVDMNDQLVVKHFTRFLLQYSNIRSDPSGSGDSVRFGLKAYLRALAQADPSELHKHQLDLEGIHKTACLYLWLSRRLTDSFRDSSSADRAMSTSAHLITRALADSRQHGSRTRRDHNRQSSHNNDKKGRNENSRRGGNFF